MDIYLATAFRVVAKEWFSGEGEVMKRGHRAI